MFPFLNGHREISIVRIQLLFRAPNHASVGEYIRLKYHKTKGHHHSAHHGHGNGHDIVEFDCVLAREYPGLYHGILNIKFKVPRMSVGYQREEEFGVISFPPELCDRGDIEEAYALVKYEYSGTREQDSGTREQDSGRHKDWIVRKPEAWSTPRRKKTLEYDYTSEGMGGLDGEEVMYSTDL
jgi:hypothetical protein